MCLCPMGRGRYVSKVNIYFATARTGLTDILASKKKFSCVLHTRVSALHPSINDTASLRLSCGCTAVHQSSMMTEAPICSATHQLRLLEDVLHHLHQAGDILDQSFKSHLRTPGWSKGKKNNYFSRSDQRFLKTADECWPGKQQELTNLLCAYEGK